jgi:uncharacterized protein YidB (DUF937 family)
LVFCLCSGGVDQDVLAVGIDPHLGYLRGTVRHEGGELAVGGLSQQLLEAGGYGFGHVFSSWVGGGDEGL